MEKRCNPKVLELVFHFPFFVIIITIMFYIAEGMWSIVKYNAAADQGKIGTSVFACLLASVFWQQITGRGIEF